MVSWWLVWLVLSIRAFCLIIKAIGSSDRVEDFEVHHADEDILGSLTDRCTPWPITLLYGSQQLFDAFQEHDR
jgi:hypothetical protein